MPDHKQHRYSLSENSINVTSTTAVQTPITSKLALVPEAHVETHSDSVTNDSSDYQNMLQIAYETIKEKEKELDLAAELRNKYLEGNAVIKAQFEELKSQVDNASHYSLSPAPTSSVLFPQESIDSMIDVSSLVRQRIRRRSLFTRPNQQHLEMLEEQLQDLQTKLEVAEQEKQQVRQRNKKKIRDLETELETTRSEFENFKSMSADEEENDSEWANPSPSINYKPKFLKRHTVFKQEFIHQSNPIPTPHSTPILDPKPRFPRRFKSVENQHNSTTPSVKSNSNLRMTEELIDKINELEIANFELKNQKEEAESKVNKLEENIGLLEKVFEQLSTKHEQIQLSYDLQQKQVRELRAKLETTALDRTFGHSANSSMNSITYSPNLSLRLPNWKPRYHLMHQRAVSNSSTYSIPAPPLHRTLLGELEGEFDVSDQSSLPSSSQPKNKAISDWIERSDQHLTDTPSPLSQNNTSEASSPACNSYQSEPNKNKPEDKSNENMPLIRANPTSLAVVRYMARGWRATSRWCYFVGYLVYSFSLALYRGPNHPSSPFH